METKTADGGGEADVVVVILEAGGRFGPCLEALRFAAPNGVVLAQDAREGALAFAARVTRRLERLGSSGHPLRAAVLSAGRASGEDVLAARHRMAEALERASSSTGCPFTVLESHSRRAPSPHGPRVS